MLLAHFYNKGYLSVDEEKAVDFVYLEFDTISQSILLEKLSAYGLEGAHCLLGKKLAVWPGPGSDGE